MTLTWEKKKHKIAVNPNAKGTVDPEPEGMVFGPMAYRQPPPKDCGCNWVEFQTTHIPTGYAMLAFTHEPGAIEYCERIASLPFVNDLKNDMTFETEHGRQIQAIGTEVRKKFPWEPVYRLCEKHTEEEENECHACGRSCDC